VPNRIIPDTAWAVTLREESGIPLPWVAEFLRSHDGRRAIEGIARGTSGIWKITKASLARILVPVASESHMQRTSTLAMRFDDHIRVLSSRILAVREWKRGLMKVLLTGQRRFPAFSDHSWIEDRLGNLFDERNETGCLDLPLLSVTGDRGIIPRGDLDRRDTSNADKANYQHVCVGDIAYNTMRMWQGVSALSAHDGIVSPAYTVLIPSGGMIGRYARHLFKNARVVHTFWRHSQGLVDDTLSLKYPSFARIRVRFPQSIDEQRQIVNVLDTIDREIALLEQQRDAYDAQKRALLQRHLSCDIDSLDPAA
jgi:type I restriction enzyme S subunit